MKLKLAQKISLFVAAIILFVCVLMGFLSITYSSNALLESQEESMSLIADEGAIRVSLIVTSDLQQLNEVTHREFMGSMDWEVQKSFLAKDVDRLGYLDMAIVSLDGTARYIISGETSQLGDRDYVQKAFNGSSNVSNVIISKVTNSPVIMYAVPIFNSEQEVVGALVGRKDGTALNEITDAIGIGKRGYAFILGTDSTFYAHPNKDLVLNQVNVFNEIETNGALKSFGLELKELGIGKAGIVSYDYDGDSRITALSPVEGTDWVLGIGNYESDILVPIKALKTYTYIITFIMLLLGIVAGIINGIMITKPIKKLLSVIEAMTDYDFRINSENRSKKDDKMMNSSDEIGIMVRSVVKMKENLKALIQSVSENSQLVAASSEELTSIAQQSATASNDIAIVIDEIAKGATDQAKETEVGSDNINVLGDLIKNEKLSINQLNTSINEIDTLKEMGLDAIKDLQDKNIQSGHAASNIRQVIIETNQSAEEIKKASDMIKSISDQTNLLALNAAIEAARAGDAGKGFAVVADEIRNLADQSNQFTGEIDKVIQELSRKIETSVKAIESVGTIMELQSNSVSNTNEKFIGISEAIENIKIIISDINNSSSIMQKKGQDIVSVMENLSAISEENAAGTQEAAASVEEQTASMDEIANASESLAKLAEELQMEVGKFKY